MFSIEFSALSYFSAENQSLIATSWRDWMMAGTRSGAISAPPLHDLAGGVRIFLNVQGATSRGVERARARLRIEILLRVEYYGGSTVIAQLLSTWGVLVILYQRRIHQSTASGNESFEMY